MKFMDIGKQHTLMTRLEVDCATALVGVVFCSAGAFLAGLLDDLRDGEAAALRVGEAVALRAGDALRPGEAFRAGEAFFLEGDALRPGDRDLLRAGERDLDRLNDDSFCNGKIKTKEHLNQIDSITRQTYFSSDIFFETFEHSMPRCTFTNVSTVLLKNLRSALELSSIDVHVNSTLQFEPGNFFHYVPLPWYPFYNNNN